jgi:hypothetical protein
VWPTPSPNTNSAEGGCWKPGSRICSSITRPKTSWPALAACWTGAAHRRRRSPPTAGLARHTPRVPSPSSFRGAPVAHAH